MSRDGACWRCDYFDRDNDDPDEIGFCRRYPPTCAIDDDGEMVVMWPGVEYLEWCGEFQETEDKGAGIR